MKHKFYFKLPKWSTLLGLIVLGTIAVCNEIFLERTFPEEPLQLVLDRNIPLTSAYDDEEQIAQLRKGETVSYLGVVAGNGRHPVGLVVQTKSGERGLISTVKMNYPLRFTDNEADSSQVFIQRVTKSKSGHPMYEIRTSKGETKTVSLDDVRPVLPENMRYLRIKKNGDYYLTKEKFEKLYIGATLAENEARYRPAMHLDKTSKGWKAYYPNLEVIVRDEGRMYNPIITYDARGIATGYEWEKYYFEQNNRTRIKWLPYLSKIIDNDFFAHLIEGSLYTNCLGENEDDYSADHFDSWKDIPLSRWVGLLSWLIFGLIWLFFFGTLPSLIAEASLYCRHLYYFIPDIVLEIAFVALGLAATYIWFVLATVWGCLFVFIPIPLIAGIVATVRSVRFLDTQPHARCLKCRRMEVDYKEVVESAPPVEEWRSDKVETSRIVEKWKTWKEYRVADSSGIHTENRDVKDHVHTTIHYKDYKVKYLVTRHQYHYHCPYCQNVETLFGESLVELDRRQTGEHDEHSSSTSYASPYSV